MGHIVKLNNDQIMNYSNAINENNINVKNNKGLDQVPDSPEADLKRLFNPAMVVEGKVSKQTNYSTDGRQVSPYIPGPEGMLKEGSPKQPTSEGWQR
ncbi:hypothetical protein TNIN_80621 [Trichonephila inaurata madagascariensis]|uniref:Uncharacterized protein n=1 Tax=Trichonephila inaurata madagascariensis TaxID=2747483 RepID=A0A8X6WMW2_9ARAC|nr:hypothetical protein TNIN_80621 [Trichonephila inaurata madagascariensis]